MTSATILPFNSPGTLQRARGSTRIAFDAGGLSDLYQQGCLKTLIPARSTEAVLINTSGGITGGDALAIDIRARDTARVTATTQAAERIYRSRQADGRGRVDIRLEVGAGARLDWLPQETIVYDGAGLERHINVHSEAGAEILMAESFIWGRLRHNETIRHLDIRDNWRIYQDGRLVHAESLRLNDAALFDNPTGLGGARASATLVYISDHAADRLDPLRRCLDDLNISTGASAWQGRLVIRMLARRPADLRRAMLVILQHLRGRDAPRVWQI